MLLGNPPAGIFTTLSAQIPHRAPGRLKEGTPTHQLCLYTCIVPTGTRHPHTRVNAAKPPGPCSTTRQDVQNLKEDDVEEQDDEGPDGEEEDKDDGSTHAAVVVDLAETTKPKGEREALESERRNQTNQAKMKAGAATET